MKSALIAATLMIMTAAVSIAQGPQPQFETILIPIVVPPGEEVPGAFGSRWTGEVWLRNGSEIIVGSPQGSRGCTGCTYPPGSIEKVELVTWQSAAHLFIPRSAIDEVSINARLFETSLRSQPQGVEVPVVREADLFATPVNLLAIPLSDVSRAAVRIFDPFPNTGGSTFKVDVFGTGGTLLASTVLQTRHDPALVGQPGGFGHAWTPAFAIIPDVRMAFPQLNGEERVHVRVTPEQRDPLLPQLRYWTMASVTDNETQHVLLVTPQCCGLGWSDLP